MTVNFKVFLERAHPAFEIHGVHGSSCFLQAKTEADPQYSIHP